MRTLFARPGDLDVCTGSFVTLYKLILNALPILLPSRPPELPPTPFDDSEDEIELLPKQTTHPRRVRFSLSTHAQQVWVRKRTRRWHAALAGAIAGSIAVMFEKRSRRIAVAQQMFVR